MKVDAVANNNLISVFEGKYGEGFGCELDYRWLRRIQNLRTNWNDAEVQCRIGFIRKPSPYWSDFYAAFYSSAFHFTMGLVSFDVFLNTCYLFSTSLIPRRTTMGSIPSSTALCLSSSALESFPSPAWATARL